VEDQVATGSVTESGDDDVKQTKKDASSGGMYTLGKIKQLDTEEPTLELSLGGDKNGGKRLVLKGKKIKTCGRYLVLNCKTTGTVNCRNVFEELVVFGGDYQVLGESRIGNVSNVHGEQVATGEGNHQDDDSVMVVDEEETKDTLKLQKNADDKEKVFNHYGGSERAVDGGRPVRGIKRKKSLSSVVSMDLASRGANSSRSFTQDSQEESQVEENETEIKEKGNGGGTEAKNMARVATSKTRRKSGLQQQDKSDIIELFSEEDNNSNFDDDDSNESHDDAFEMKSPISSTPRTRYTRKSATKKVKYTFDEEEEEEEEEDEDDKNSESEEKVDDDDHDKSEEESSLEQFNSPKKRSRKKAKIDSTSTTVQKEKANYGDVTVKKGQATTMKQSSVSPTTRKILSKKKVQQESNTSSTSSPAYRKRRKSPKKSTSASKSLDSMMDDDEEFLFVE
jgi:hypothetical protein